jgi:hypothetical protein
MEQIEQNEFCAITIIRTSGWLKPKKNMETSFWEYTQWMSPEATRWTRSFQLVKEAANPTEAAELFVDLLHGHIEYYLYAEECVKTTVMNSDYGLYWYDYEAGYDTVLVEFAWNHSRPLNVALCRGAANVHNKDWGSMVTWTSNQPPYLVPFGHELYQDLLTAYHNGAKYSVIFDHPATNYSDYGILTDEHFSVLENFRDYMNENADKYDSTTATAVYVLPENFGFGFRRAVDKIWGLWSPDTDSRVAKIWSDVNQLIEEYGFDLDIVYSNPNTDANISDLYDMVFYWNEPLPSTAATLNEGKYR